MRFGWVSTLVFGSMVLSRMDFCCGSIENNFTCLSIRLFVHAFSPEIHPTSHIIPYTFPQLITPVPTST